MLTRRDVIKRGVAAGVAGLVGTARTAAAAAPQPRTAVNFAVPPGACDCHVHVFGDPQKYPFFSGRTYSPETASVAELRQMLSALHLDRVVIVQPSVYGTDNSATLDGMRALGDRARGVAVIDEKTTDAQLDDMGKIGIRGIRLNLATAGVNDPSVARQRFDNAVARVRNRGWHIQFNTQLPVIDALSQQFLASPVPIVIDHFGGALAARGVEQPGFGALVNLVKAGKAYVKISGSADLVSTEKDLSDVAPFARALVAANPQRVLWGTNWPHPGSNPVAGRKPTDPAPHVQTDDGQVLNMLPVWVPDAATRQLILTDNPARLYGWK
jgi:predicted TIM-barrel fold metal-dependent hydrolase